MRGVWRHELAYLPILSLVNVLFALVLRFNVFSRAADRAILIIFIMLDDTFDNGTWLPLQVLARILILRSGSCICFVRVLCLSSLVRQIEIVDFLFLDLHDAFFHHFVDLWLYF